MAKKKKKTGNAISRAPRRPQPSASENSKSFRIDQCAEFSIAKQKNKDGGASYVALQDIKAGETILFERPIARFDEPLPPTTENLACLRREIFRWSKAEQALFFMLHNPWPRMDEVYARAYTYSAHIQTSAVDLGQKTEQLYLFLHYSFIPHSCSPNTIESWDYRLDCLRVETLIDIKKGELLTRYFLNKEHYLDRRATEHLAIFGRLCKCTACTASDGELERTTSSSTITARTLSAPGSVTGLDPAAPKKPPSKAVSKSSTSYLGPADIDDPFHFPSFDDLPYETEEPDWFMYDQENSPGVPRRLWSFLGEIVRVDVVRPLRLIVQDKWGDIGCILFRTPLEGYEVIKYLKNARGSVIVLEWAYKVLAPGDESVVIVTDPNRVGIYQAPLRKFFEVEWDPVFVQEFES